MTPAKTAPEPAQKDAAGTGETTEESLLEENKQLDQKKAELEKLYRTLTDERQKLDSRRGEFRTKAAVREYEAQIRNLNERNAAFETQREAFKKEVEDYNKRSEAYYKAQEQETKPSP